MNAIKQIIEERSTFDKNCEFYKESMHKSVPLQKLIIEIELIILLAKAYLCKFSNKADTTQSATSYRFRFGPICLPPISGRHLMGAHIIYWSLLEMCYVCKSTVTQVEKDGMVLCEMTNNIKLWRLIITFVSLGFVVLLRFSVL